MLIDDKFIYLSLPRCASTSFHYSCIVQNIKIENYDLDWNLHNSTVNFQKIDKTEIMNHIHHGHESLLLLKSKYGDKYPIIAVNRDRHERFYSLYKHVLSDFKRMGLENFYDVFSKLTLNELFFFDVNDLYDKKTRWNRISQYLIDLGLMDEHIDIKVTHFNRKHEVDYWKKEKKAYVINLLDIFISPLSYWTNNDKNIIWFDFNDMSKMEKWISEMIGKNFKMESVNSSKHVNCDIKLDEFFIEKYNSIYDYYDLPKNKKTLI